jgi:hypothetical protein
MPSGYPVPPLHDTVSEPSTSVLGEASLGRGGQRGESLARESWWVSGVLVDIKLVAEIGEKHLVSRRLGRAQRKLSRAMNEARPVRAGAPSP